MKGTHATRVSEAPSWSWSSIDGPINFLLNGPDSPVTCKRKHKIIQQNTSLIQVLLRSNPPLLEDSDISFTKVTRPTLRLTGYLQELVLSHERTDELDFGRHQRPFQFEQTIR